MNKAKTLVVTETSQLLFDFKKQLQEEIERNQEKIKSFKQSKYTPVGELDELKQAIESDRYAIEDISIMEFLKQGDWVQNGSSRPGEIVGFVVKDRKPLIQIRWWLEEELDAKSPRNLKILPQSEMAWIWYGERFEKLVRKCDRFECNDIGILSEEMEKEKSDREKFLCKDKAQLAICDRRISYCQSRIELLSQSQKNNRVGIPVANTLDPNIEEIEINIPDRGISEAQEQLLTRLYGSERIQEKLITLSISQIRRNPLCQQREELDEKVVEEYKEAFLSGVKLPPVKVKHDGASYWLYDGFHTTQAAINAGLTDLQVEVTKGLLRDAILASVGVNASHGLRRSNETKRNAVRTLLQDEEWGARSNVWIAEACKVSESFVRTVRKEVGEPRDEVLYRNKYGNEVTMNKNRLSTNGHIVLNDVSKDTNSTKEFNGKQEYLAVNSLSNPESGIEQEDFLQKGHKEFFANQLLQLKLSSFDGVPESLKNLNHSYCVVATTTETGNYNVKFFGRIARQSSYVVKPEDLKAVESVSLTLTLPAEKYLSLLNRYEGRDEIESAIYKCLEA